MRKQYRDAISGPRSQTCHGSASRNGYGKKGLAQARAKATALWYPLEGTVSHRVKICRPSMGTQPGLNPGPLNTQASCRTSRTTATWYTTTPAYRGTAHRSFIGAPFGPPSFPWLAAVGHDVAPSDEPRRSPGPEWAPARVRHLEGRSAGSGSQPPAS